MTNQLTRAKLICQHARTRHKPLPQGKARRKDKSLRPNPALSSPNSNDNSAVAYLADLALSYPYHAQPRPQ